MSKKLFKPAKGSLKRSETDSNDQKSEHTSKVITWGKNDAQGKIYGFLEKSVFIQREHNTKNVFLHENNFKIPEMIEVGDYVHFTLSLGTNIAQEVFKVPKPKREKKKQSRRSKTTREKRESRKRKRSRSPRRRSRRELLSPSPPWPLREKKRSRRES